MSWNMESWNNKSKRLKKLIMDVSDKHGGDDKDFLNEYIEWVIKEYSNDLDSAIICFEYILKDEICTNHSDPPKNI